jgi:hypothetical protein
VLYDAQSTTLTATQGAISGTTANSFKVIAGPLAPSFGAQPADTQVSQVIYSDQATKAPVTVMVADAYGNPAPNGTPVMLTAPATLAGTLSEPTTAGVASYSDLSLPATGTYQLTAQAVGQQKMSDPFQVVTHLQICIGVSCSTGDVGNGSQTSNTTITAGGTAFQSLVLTTNFAGVAPPVGVCNGFTPIPGTSGAQIEVEGTDVAASQPSFKITLTVTKATLKAAGLGNLGAAQFDICLGAKGGNAPWIGKSGKAVFDQATGLYWGVVPDQSSSLPATNPYIISKNKTGSGNLVIVFYKPFPWDGWGYV